MNTRPTPETDREDIIITKGKPTHWVSKEFARRLECERDEAREKLDRGLKENRDLWSSNAELIEQRDRLAEACDQYSEDEILCKLQKITEQRDSYKERYTKLAGKYAVEIHELTEQRDRLAVALKEIEWSNDSQWQADRARSALQSLTPNAIAHTPATNEL